MNFLSSTKECFILNRESLSNDNYIPTDDVCQAVDRRVSGLLQSPCSAILSIATALSLTRMFPVFDRILRRAQDAGTSYTRCSVYHYIGYVISSFAMAHARHSLCRKLILFPSSWVVAQLFYTLCSTLLDGWLSLCYDDNA